MPNEIKTVDSAIYLMRDVARMAVNAGKGINKGAGYGYVGMLNGFTVKIATHYGERTSEEKKSEAMIKSSDELRSSLKSAIDVLVADKSGEKEKASLRKIYKTLGLDPNGVKKANAPLITRSIALSVVKDVKKLASNGSLDYVLDNLVGERTITKSSTNDLKTMMGDAFSTKNEFMEKQIRPILDSMFPRADERSLRLGLEDDISHRLVVKDGKLEVVGGNVGLANIADKNNSAVKFDSFSEIVDEFEDNALENRDNKKSQHDKDFSDAIAKLFHKTMVEKDPSWSLRNLASPEIPKSDPVKTDVFPEDQTQRDFTIFKSLAQKFPPVEEKTPKGSLFRYYSFQSWLAKAAADAAGTTIDELTLGQVRKYVADHIDVSIDTLGAKRHEEASIPHLNGKLSSYLGKNCLMIDDNEFAALLSKSYGKGGRKEGLQLLNTSTIYSLGGGLVSVNKSKFSAGGHEVTSTVTPRRKFSTPRINAELSNFASSELTDENGGVLFMGIRFGTVTSLQRDIFNQHDHYGQLVEQILLQNADLKKQAVDNGKIDLPVYRIDMSDLGNLSKCAKQYRINIEGKEVVVTPQVRHFRIPTDSADLSGGKWYCLSKKNVDSNTLLLNDLCGRVNESHDSKVRNLAKQLKDYWVELQVRHGDGNGNIRLFKGYGAEMMRFGARIAVLAGMLGDVPSYNCNGGRDRTGLMDVECKTTALWLKDHDELPPVKGESEPMEGAGKSFRNLRKEMRDKSGNQSIARQILLNDDNMYMSQVALSMRIWKCNENEYPFPNEIADNEGTGKAEWKYDNHTRISGLHGLY